MKRQQMISRFFAAKPKSNNDPSTSSLSAAAPKNPPPPPSLPRELPKVAPPPNLPSERPLPAAATTLEWPPRGRRRPLDPSPSLPSREEDTGRNFGDSSPIKRIGNEALGFKESHPLMKRPRLVGKSSPNSSHGVNKPQANAVIQKCSTSHSPSEVAVSVDDCEMLQHAQPTEDDHEADDGIQAANDSPLDSPPVQLISDGEELGLDDQLTVFEGPTLTPNSQQRKVGSTPVQGRPQKGIPPFDPAKHKRFVDKMLARTAPNGEMKKPWYGSPPIDKEKLTPLETQVAELKAKYPDVLLMVEVGYRYRFYGDDAETASRTLGIAAYYDHSFLTASIPTFRLHFHVRRLVEAGLKVGVVRQTETAAIKGHGANKADPFTRGLSALYTRATIEAVEDLGGGAAAAGVRTLRLNSYLMCIVEMPMQGGKRSLGEKRAGTGWRRCGEGFWELDWSRGWEL